MDTFWPGLAVIIAGSKKKFPEVIDTDNVSTAGSCKASDDAGMIVVDGVGATVVSFGTAWVVVEGTTTGASGTTGVTEDDDPQPAPRRMHKPQTKKRRFI